MGRRGLLLRIDGGHLLPFALLGLMTIGCQPSLEIQGSVELWGEDGQPLPDVEIVATATSHDVRIEEGVHSVRSTPNGRLSPG